MPFIVLMGVSGSGKTAVGQALARKLGCAFLDGDDFHPASNIAKMSRGQPLNDADRLPWLARLNTLIGEHLRAGKTAVLACSALRKSYRDQLRGNHGAVRFVFLDGSFELIRQRLAARQGHYMKVNLLRSQFDALERPSATEAITIPIDQSVNQIVTAIKVALNAGPSSVV